MCFWHYRHIIAAQSVWAAALYVSKWFFMTKIQAYLGIGGNLVPYGYDNLLDALEAAIAQIGVIAPVTARSSWYKTAPVPVSDQPDFLNAVLAVQTADTPDALLAQLNQIEAGFGRVRSIRNAARVLDIDILFFGNQIITEEELQIPHPRLHQRAFVLRPLNEIAPDFCHPVNGWSVRALYQDFLAGPDGDQACLPLR